MLKRRFTQQLALAPLLVALWAAPLAAASKKAQKNNGFRLRGVISSLETSGFTLLDPRGQVFSIRTSSATRILEKRKNFLRSPLVYSRRDLVPGLEVEVRGHREGGGMWASRIRFTQTSLRVARALDSPLHPLRRHLQEVEQKVRGQGVLSQQLALKEGRTDQAVRELDAALADLRSSSSREHREWTLRLLETRRQILELDDYQVKAHLVVTFAFASDRLSQESRESLDQLAQQASGLKGYLIEVSGFASSDGDPAYNRRLSQRRARRVAAYLAESHDIPLRRILPPHGFGPARPVADNSTLEGRRSNRRVEVRLLVGTPFQASGQLTLR